MAGLRATAARWLPWVSVITPAVARHDLVAALTNATVVIPQAVAFATIAGLPPEYGLFTALLPPVIAILFGSSWHLVSGPTSAISALVFGALAARYIPGSNEYVSAALALAFLVGLTQVALGLARLGQLVTFVSKSVLIGFTWGAALLIVASQLDGVLGIELPRPEDAAAFLAELARAFPSTDLPTLLVAMVTLLAAILVRRVRPRWPHYLVALVAGSLAAWALRPAGFEVPTIGALPAALPDFGAPPVTLSSVRELSQAALAIALVGLLEAVSIARSTAARTGQDIDSSREFVGQGLANAAGSFFSAFPSSGSFTRTGVNVDAGARTPLAVLLTSLMLLAAMPALVELFAYVPSASISAVIVLVAINLIDPKELERIVRTSVSEGTIALVTLATALLVGLEFSIYVGVILSLLLFLNRTTHPYVGIGAPDPSTAGRIFRNAESNRLAECPQLLFLRVDGPLYFGSLDSLRERLRAIEAARPGQRHALMILRSLGSLDLPVAELLIEEARRRRSRGGSLNLAARLPREVSRLRHLGVLDALGPEKLYPSKGEAIAGIVPRLDDAVCAACTARVFGECASRPGGRNAAAGSGEDGQRSPLAADRLS